MSERAHEKSISDADRAFNRKPELNTYCKNGQSTDVHRIHH